MVLRTAHLEDAHPGGPEPGARLGGDEAEEEAPHPGHLLDVGQLHAPCLVQTCRRKQSALGAPISNTDKRTYTPYG